MSTTAEETRAIAREAAREAVREWLVSLGLDASTPEAIVEVQKDFAHVRSWRRSIETANKTVIKTGITVIVSGLLGALWMIFRPPG